jgi:co-chaperonin GroES (HSP10)
MLTPTQDKVLIDPLYDPEKVGSIWMPDQARNSLPSNGDVVAVGPEQTEIEIGFRVLVSTYGVGAERFIWHEDKELAIYHDHEVVAFLAPDAEVFPRRDSVIVRPSWTDPVDHKRGSIHLLTRVFTAPPVQMGVVLRVGSEVSTIRRGMTILIPRTGGQELGVRDRVLYSIKATDIPGVINSAVENDTTQPDCSRGAAT